MSNQIPDSIESQSQSRCPTQDLPCKFTVDKTLQQPQPEKAETTRGRGRGRSSNKGKGRSGKGSQENKESESKPPPKTPPSLLTNLVRLGNQMGQSQSWRCILKNLTVCISQRLTLAPRSSLTAEQERAQMQVNRTLLILLDILDSSQEVDNVLPPQKADVDMASTRRPLREAAEELLKFLVSL